ncbi:cysteine synthase family protein [Sodalis sp. dw_96]|uniref:PLP-dependent cysteine synthase family protein n=1 Tax=Sodalis sp. dw_96 TaxID=2719794 RepID=UPI001BD50ABA|nr:cysteine synthase family protein [Sodalis sp. dw_96]
MGRNIKKSIAELIGYTPLLELSQYEKLLGLDAHIIAKLEYFNPNNSVKDRIALAMVEDAENRGLLKKGDTIIETTSGNTGIALAAIAASRGYKFRTYIQDRVSIERTKVIQAFGGEVIKFSQVEPYNRIMEETHGDFIAATRALVDVILSKEKNIFFSYQIENKINPAIHEKSTGPEIWRDTDGDVDILVAAVGTGGTLSGAGAYLRKKKPLIHIVAVQPGPDSVPTDDNPEPDEIAGVHRFSDMPPDRIPHTFNLDILDEAIAVETSEARTAARAVAKSDGILVGTSSGAVLHAATLLARRAENKGKTIVVIFADTGLHYLSTDLFTESVSSV